MCAINGFTWGCDDTIQSMMQSTWKRGPDDEGYYTCDEFTIGHNLLNINSPESYHGVQPKISSKGNILAFNGQIYGVGNELDTDYLLRKLDYHGVDFLKNLDGHFAIVWYNKQEHALYLIRDHLGTKPLFYSHTPEGDLVFSSEIKSFHESGILKLAWDYNVERMLKRGNFWNKGRITLFKNVRKLAPGEVMKFCLHRKKIVSKTSLWDGHQFVTEDYNEQEFRYITEKTILKVAETTRPLTLMLSGGLDSNLIAGVLAKNNVDFNAVTLSYDVKDPAKSRNTAMLDEWWYAQKTVNKYNIPWRCIAMELDDETNNRYQQISLQAMGTPMEDTMRAVTRCCVMEDIANNNGKVVLSGDGADELFTGYNQHADYIDNDFVNPFEKIKTDRLLSGWFPKHVLGDDPVNNSLFIHLLSKTESQILRNDMIAGSFSLESRTPFTMQSYVKYLMSIPSHIKLQYKTRPFKGRNKYLIREVFQDVLPQEFYHKNNKVGWHTPYYSVDGLHDNTVQYHIDSDIRNVKNNFDIVE